MAKNRWFAFNPKREIWTVLLSYIPVVAFLYLAFNVITTRLVALNFITFGLIVILGFGVAFPVAWSLLVWKRTLPDLGITRRRLAPSILLGIALTAVQYVLTLRTIQLPPLEQLVPLMTMALAVGLYESIFYRGWIQLRMEESFGIVPAILISALLYSLYHIGYGMRPDEMAFLFVIGLIYSIVFRLTSNIFILYPFLTPTGAIFSQIKDGLTLPFPATYGFADVIAACIVVIWLVERARKRRLGRSNQAIGQPV